MAVTDSPPPSKPPANITLPNGQLPHLGQDQEALTLIEMNGRHGYFVGERSSDACREFVTEIFITPGRLQARSEESPKEPLAFFHRDADDEV